MQYVDPRYLDKVQAPRVRYDEDEDFVVLFGCLPHTPAIYDDDGRCETCGFVRGDRISRTRTRLGRVVCSDCCRGSLDGKVEYPGYEVDEYPDVEYLRKYAKELGIKPPKYKPGTLKGGTEAKAKTKGGRGAKKKTKGGRGSKKKGVAK